MINKKVNTIVLVLVFALSLVSCKKQVERVNLDKHTIEVIHGDTFSLRAKIMPADADDQTVAWNVDSQNVSPVTNEDTAEKEFLAAEVGSAQINVITSNGKNDSCHVTVHENAEDIAIRVKAEEEERIAAEKRAEEERIAAEKRAEEERIAKEKAEQEEKMGYETGITYDQLARTPDDYKEKKVKFYGRVIQVVEGKGETNLRVATKASSYGSYYDDVVLVYYNPSIMTSRVLEDDMITLYGVSKGLYTYESTMGGNITVPLISVDKIEIK